MYKVFLILFFFINILTNAQCLNATCEEAIELTLCEPYYFNTDGCPDFGIYGDSPGWPVLQSAYILPQGPPGTANYSGIWPYNLFKVRFFKLSVILAAHYDFQYISTVTSPHTNQGTGWAWLYGGCDDLNVTMNTATNSPVGWFSASTAWSAPWTSPTDGFITFWVEEPIGWPYPPYQGTVSNTTNWNMTFYLIPGEYIILVSSRQLNTVADGYISVCKSTPLNIAPILSVNGLTLSWVSDDDSEHQIEYYDVIKSDWILEKSTLNKSYVVSRGGVYRVWNKYGVSKPVNVKKVINIDKPMRFNILGQELYYE